MDKPLVDPDITKAAEAYVDAYHNFVEGRIPFREFGHLVQQILTEARNLPVITEETDVNNTRQRVRGRIALAILTTLSSDLEVLIAVMASIPKQN
jgi:hypothetical protein